jgi:FtsP/CotA-like multicopper oxidase with cupredoxin domain
MQAGPAGAEQIAAQTLATISVTTGAASTESLADLSFTPTRPGYLADLQAATVHGSKEIEINGGNGCSVNDAPWAGDGTDHLFTVYESTREEYTISAANHPIHIHVNPIQVIRDDDDWNQPGDWMDVVMSNGVYRQHLADHTGVVIVHCHWLSHEDLGCMSQFTIDSCATDDVAAGVLGTCSTADTGLETWVIVLLAVASAAVFLGGVCLACRVSKSSKKEEGSKP